MKIVTTRRISQIFFFALFIWFCIVTSLGERAWQLRGWPVNWLLQLDPLVGLSVLLATHTLYAGLLWGALTIALTFVLGRFFCGWLCPFGALQQFMGFLGKRGLKTARRIALNRPHPAQRIKYWLLLFILAAAAADLLGFLLRPSQNHPAIFWPALAAVLFLLWVVSRKKGQGMERRTAAFMGAVVLLAVAGSRLYPERHWLAVSLQSGLLDPIALVYRSVNLAVLPFMDAPVNIHAPAQRFYPGVATIGLLFLITLLLSMRIPRFYCRFICPLGALLGLAGRWSIWRIGKKENGCTDCRLCERDCEGACAPTGQIRISECVLCLNCIDQCRHGVMGYHLHPSSNGEIPGPDLTRRQVVTAVAAGVATVPMIRLDGQSSTHWNPAVIRPPGALAEIDFLSRCIKCGQCMRICPTNVIHPAGWQCGLEGLWTPMLDFRAGTSGCQHNCVACSFICPTAALRPLTVDERMGRGAFAEAGPVRIGMAFVDRGRCLPWAMDTPCIVCQENCPMSPKAIFTRHVMQPVRNGRHPVASVEQNTIHLQKATLLPGRYATGDYSCTIGEQSAFYTITANSADSLTVATQPGWSQPPEPGAPVTIFIQLQRPYVDPHQCIGCGVCEHECPVQGRRAIRVTAENESRQRAHQLIVS